MSIVFRRWLALTSIVVFGALLSLPSRSSNFVVGINGSVRDGGQAMAAAESLGISSIRIDVPWQETERSKGSYSIPEWVEESVTTARGAGVEPLLILAYGNTLYGITKPRSDDEIAAFGRYASYVVRHFGTRVKFYELWNEWNTTTGHTSAGSPEDYIRLESAICPALKMVQSGIVVISGAPSGKGLRDGWMAKYLQLGGNKVCDGLSLHPYGWYDSATPESAVRLIDEVENLAQRSRSGRAVPLYITEMGWPTHEDRLGVSRAKAAENLVRFYLSAASREFVAGVWWYCLRDTGPNRKNSEQNFGVFDNSFGRKDAALAFPPLAKALRLQRPVVDGDAHAAGEYVVSVKLSDESSPKKVTWVEAEPAGQNANSLRDFLHPTVPSAPVDFGASPRQ